MLDNLLSNAIKFTRAGGRVELTAERVEEQAVIRVRDTGIGIAPEHRAKLFEPFTQIGPTTQRAGLGLGLSLVANLAELHDGSIEVHSDGVDQGSEFVLRLPLAGDAVEQASATARESRAMQILVVDDDVDLHMPTMDGYALARELRRRFEDAPLTLVALTGFSAEPGEEDTRRAGFDHRLLKPVDLAQLSALFSSLE